MTIRSGHHVPEYHRISYALGDGSPVDRARVAEHLLSCSTCRADVEVVANLAAHARAVPLEIAPPHALQRILADRMTSEGTPGTVPRGGAGWRWAAGAAVAASLLVIAPMLRHRAPIDRGATLESDLLAFMGSPIAFAQVPAGPLSDVDAARAGRLRSGTWVYQRMSPKGDARTPLLIEERIAAPGGADPVVVAHRRTGVSAWADTLVVDPRTLVPIRFVLRRNPVVWVETRIAAGRVTHSYPIRTGRDPIVRHVEEVTLPPVLSGKPFLITTDRGLPLYVRALPLRRGAEFRIGALRTTSSASGFSAKPGAVVLRVTGEEVVQVPAGVFDAWRVVAEGAGDLRRELWVAKGSQVLLRDRVSGPGRNPFELALVSGEVY